MQLSRFRRAMRRYPVPALITLGLLGAFAIGCGSDSSNSPTGVADVAPTANFTNTSGTGSAPLTVQFADTSVPGSSPITAWSWDFGDGGTSNLQNPSHIYTTIGTFAVSLTVTSAVGSDTKAKPGQVQIMSIPPATIEAIIADAGKSDVLGEEDDDITFDPPEDRGDFRYTYEKHDVLDNVDNITYFGLNDDIIWPGSVIDGSRIHDFVYQPITVPRAPVTLSVSLETSGTGSTLTRSVENPALSTIRQGISDLLADATATSPSVAARVEFSYEEVFNQTHVDVSVAGQASNALSSLGINFDWQSTEETTRIVAKYKQIYFTIDMDTPASPAEFFPASISEPVLRAAFVPGSRPMYVAGVSYGMMALMTIQSSYKAESVKAALDFARQGRVDVEVEAGVSVQTLLTESTVKIAVYGGSTKGLQDIELNFTGFMNIVNASSQFGADTPAVPLAYKFRHMTDNTLAAVTLQSEYTRVIPLRIRQPVRITAVKFKCTRSDDEGLGNVDMDRFGLGVKAYYRTAPGAPREAHPATAAGGYNVFNWGTSGEVNMGAGAEFICEGKATNVFDLTFDTDQFDFQAGEMEFYAYGRDWDGDPFFNDPDTGSGSRTIVGDLYLDGGGEHKVSFSHPDFDFDAYFTIELR